MNKQKGYTIFEVIVLIIAIFGIYGWVANIVSLAHSTFDPLTGMVVLRVVGIFVAPLGAVLGYF
jgi:hypothetical protein